ncbi:hypothetical protein A2115_01495 [Candidatus Woesebacteria bacterium GWA1_41_8]|uniref:Methyltransferase FkbM domain-containing protein n=1 Tax=Candidatus Woesebacteria bacterium GWA1_41_8 TaxID=1802471 RepID=A0A1F7WHY8_9BACT|nr:MAG: hypothetical protein A2115_01495 [Candidatus Woesebacteria bacterium GWA1_41_8]
MNKLEKIYRFFDNIATLARNVNPMSEKIYHLFLYLYLTAKGYFFIKILRLRITNQEVFGQKIYFPDFFLFLRIFFEVFIWKPYDFNTKNPTPKIIDCGANIGIASLYFKLKYPKAKVICFEPSQPAFEYLKRNLSFSKDFILVNAALLKSNKGIVNLKSPENFPEAALETSIFSTRWPGLKIREERVKAVKLSDYIEQNDVIDFLKIDVEGAESQVLEDLDQSSKLGLIKEMSVEYHHFSNDGSLKNILNILSKNGFKLIISGGVRPPLWWYKNKFYAVLIYAYRK